MNTIPIEVSGDTWYNPERVQQQLDQIPPGQQVTLDFRAEGPCMERLGIRTVIDAWIQQRAMSPDQVTVVGWSNGVEQIPYAKHRCSVPSHFWMMGQGYWTETNSQQLPPERWFGLFLGRSTIARNIIMFESWSQWSQYFLFSRMQSVQPDPWNIRNPQLINHEKLDHWNIDVDKVKQWFEHCPISSIDQKNIKDQFESSDANKMCIQSLLEHYPRFAIELCCETYTLGETFFPTEKTVRPIVAGKPFLCYGPVNFLKRLQEMKFQTFHTLWSEDYDRYEGSKRWTAIKQTIEYITGLDDSARVELVQKANQIAQSNRELYKKFAGENFLYGGW
jgi:hypothetical protein